MSPEPWGEMHRGCLVGSNIPVLLLKSFSNIKKQKQNSMGVTSPTDQRNNDFPKDKKAERQTHLAPKG